MTGKMYRIGEAAALLGLKSYVLRFWETEFPQLEPVRTEKGQRLYTEEHIELLRLIKNLLHERGLTIDGARRILNSSDPQKNIQGEKGSLLASEFSSELLLGRPYLDEEYEDDEAEDAFDPRLDALLSEVIEELEDIRELLAPLDDVPVNNSAGRYFNGPIVMHEATGSESMPHVTATFWNEDNSDEDGGYEDVSEATASSSASIDIQPNIEDFSGREVPKQLDNQVDGQREEEADTKGKFQAQFLNSQADQELVESARAFCEEAEAHEDEELEENSQATDETDAPIFKFLRNFEKTPG